MIAGGVVIETVMKNYTKVLFLRTIESVTFECNKYN